MKYLKNLKFFTESKKHIKQYEEMNKTPEVGDYVILFDDTGEINDNFVDYSNFINNNVGKIIDIKSRDVSAGYLDISYDIEYENIPNNLLPLFAVKKLKNDKIIRYEMSRPESDIIFSSKNKIDAELFLSTKKYNL